MAPTPTPTHSVHRLAHSPGVLHESVSKIYSYVALEPFGIGSDLNHFNTLYGYFLGTRVDQAIYMRPMGY